MQMRIQRSSNKRRRRTPVGRLQVVAVFEQFLCIREVLQQLCEELHLFFSHRFCALNNLHAVSLGNILHVSCRTASLDVPAFLYQPCHRLLLPVK